MVTAPTPVGPGPVPRLGALLPALTWLATVQGAWPPRLPREVRVVTDEPGTFDDGLARADSYADTGVDLLVVRASGDPVPGMSVVAALLDVEPVAAVGTAAGPDWTTLTLGVRDGLRACRPHVGDPEALLAAAGGDRIAPLAALLAQAAVRRTPVLLDGSALTCGAAYVAERCAPGADTWWLAGQRPPAPIARRALAELELTPLLDLALDHPAGGELALAVLRQAVALVAAADLEP